MANFKLLGDRLTWAKAEKEKRDGRAYAWADLARACTTTGGPVSTAAVSRWKNNLNGIHPEFARPLGAWLGVDPIWLETGIGEPQPTTRVIDPSTPEGEKALREEATRAMSEFKDFRAYRASHPLPVKEREDRRDSLVGRRTTDRAALDGEIEIPQFKEIGGSMGAGLLLRDQPGEIHHWSVTKDWITKNVKNHTSDSNLRIVTGFGDSMRPLYNPGDPLLVDAGVKSVEFDSIYFFRIGDEGFIKRLQRVPGQGLIAISENKSYRDWVVNPDMDFEVFARVIKVWRGSDF